MLLWDDETLVWLIHSAPQFPPLQKDKYSFPKSAMRNGQSALCLALKTASDLDTVAGQLHFNWPYIYEQNVNRGLLISLSKLVDWSECLVIT